jgi:peptidoglycan/xylan/chitin deacetylase (PgdA/CDA1 family)
MILPVIALKVDVDTYVGTRDGVPRLLDILDQYGIKATFYFSLGPDNSGKAIRRIFTRKGFLKKMLRTKAPSTYGLKTLLYGTLLPAPNISQSLAGVMKEVAREGHEVGIHAWDHVDWHDNLPAMSLEMVSTVVGRAREAFREIFGKDAKTTAAPGWMLTASSLEVQDGMGLLYSSDARGKRPFFPLVGGRRFETLQIPTTLPTMDELLGLEGITGSTVNNYYLSRIGPGLNVHTIHAELEGARLAGTFSDLLRRIVHSGVRFTTLAEAAEESLKGHPPTCNVVMEAIPGRAGLVAVQQG